MTQEASEEGYGGVEACAWMPSHYNGCGDEEMEETVDFVCNSKWVASCPCSRERTAFDTQPKAGCCTIRSSDGSTCNG
jgi:hypothetical protein